MIGFIEWHNRNALQVCDEREGELRKRCYVKILRSLLFLAFRQRGLHILQAHASNRGYAKELGPEKGRKTGHEEKMQPRFVKGNFDLSTGSGFHLILMQSQVHGLDTACTM